MIIYKRSGQCIIANGDWCKKNYAKTAISGCRCFFVIMEFPLFCLLKRLIDPKEQKRVLPSRLVFGGSNSECGRKVILGVRVLRISRELPGLGVNLRFFRPRQKFQIDRFPKISPDTGSANWWKLGKWKTLDSQASYLLKWKEAS